MTWAEQDLAVDGGGSGGGGGGSGGGTSAAASSSSSSSSSFDDVDSADDIVKLMVIFCSIVFVVFTFVYLVLWRRGKRNNEQALEREVDGENENDDDDNKTAEFLEDDEDGDSEEGHQRQRRRSQNREQRQQQQQQQQQQQRGRIRYSEAHEPVRERQPGDPVYDKFLVSGTMSLGIILWVGATIVLIMSLIDNADHTTANASDFQSLGPNACQIINASSYTYFDNELTSQQTICVEQWEYLVEITVPTSTSTSTSASSGSDTSSSPSSSTYFVSAPIAVTSCGIKCDLCQREGPGYFAGVDSREKGVAIVTGGGPTDDTNSSSSSNNSSRSSSAATLVECWEPTIPVDDLSDFYDCGPQRNNGDGDGDGDGNSTCYLLVDSASQLKVEQQSSQIGIIVACVGYVVGLFLILLSSYWIRKNRRIREQELLEQQEQSELETKAKEQAGDDNGDEVCEREVDETIEDGDGGGGGGIAVSNKDSNGQTTTTTGTGTAAKEHVLDKEMTSPLEEEDDDDDDEEEQGAKAAAVSADEVYETI